jgi:hypothetical protein
MTRTREGQLGPTWRRGLRSGCRYRSPDGRHRSSRSGRVAGAAALAVAAVFLTSLARAQEPTKYPNTITIRGETALLDGIYCADEHPRLGGRTRDFIDALLSKGGLKRCHFTDDVIDGIATARCDFNRQDIGAQLIAAGYCGRCAGRDPDGSYVEPQEQAGDWDGPLPDYCR